MPAKFEAFSAYKARLNGKDVRLVSRNQKVFDYRQLLDALKLLPAEHFVLDGEIAALDEKGRSSFQLLQIFKSSGNVPLVYFAFDLLFLDGKDLGEQRLSARRKLLVKLLEKAPENIRLLVSFAAAKMNSPGCSRVWPRGPGRQTPKFSLRKRSTERRLGQIQNHQISGVRYRRLHVARGKPEPLRTWSATTGRTGWCSPAELAPVFRQGLSEPLQQAPEAEIA